MSWIDSLAGVEALEDAGLDAALVAEFERDAPRTSGREIRFSTPTFKSYSSCEVSGCGKNSFPAFSVTAAGCALMCDHCQAKILEPMIPATSPEMLDRKDVSWVTMLFTKDDWRASGGYDPDFSIGNEVWAFQLALAQAGVKPERVPDIIFERTPGGERFTRARQYRTLINDLMQERYGKTFA